MDDIDGIILIGDEESVKSYDRENSISDPNWVQRQPGEGGWKSETESKINPETTRSGKNRVDYVSSNESEDGMFYLSMHSAGHQKRYLSSTPSPTGNHVYGEGNAPNIISSGSIVVRIMRQKDSKILDLLDKSIPVNGCYKNRIINNFGTNKAINSYDKKDKQRIGPRKSDGSY